MAAAVAPEAEVLGLAEEVAVTAEAEAVAETAEAEAVASTAEAEAVAVTAVAEETVTTQALTASQAVGMRPAPPPRPHALARLRLAKEQAEGRVPPLLSQQSAPSPSATTLSARAYWPRCHPRRCLSAPPPRTTSSPRTTRFLAT